METVYFYFEMQAFEKHGAQSLISTKSWETWSIESKNRTFVGRTY